jgi:hypothetical protein
MTPPRYVERRDNQAFSGPYALSNTTLFGFLLDASMQRQQAVLDHFLNRPSGGAVDYRAVTDQALLYFSRMRTTRSLSEPDASKGWLPEQECGLWLLAASTKPVGPVSLAKQLVVFPYTLFVDSGHAAITGREVYGFPKELASLTIPQSPEQADLFQNKVVGFDRFNPQTLGVESLLIELRKVAGSCGGALHQVFDDGVQALEGILGAILGRTGRVTLPTLGLVFNALSDLVRGEVPFVFLKQFRDIEQSDRACYQAIATANSKLTAFRRAGFLSGKYELTIPTLASHPLVEELGLSTRQFDDVRGFFVDMDFQYLMGQTIWRAE